MYQLWEKSSSLAGAAVNRIQGGKYQPCQHYRDIQGRTDLLKLEKNTQDPWGMQWQQRRVGRRRKERGCSFICWKAGAWVSVVDTGISRKIPIGRSWITLGSLDASSYLPGVRSTSNQVLTWAEHHCPMPWSHWQRQMGKSTSNGNFKRCGVFIF